VDLREPLKPALPEVAQESVLPWRSVIVMMVLLNDAWTCATPSDTFFLTFCARGPKPSAAFPGGSGRFCLPWVVLSDLAGGRVELDGGLARSLTGARVGAGALAAHGQPFAMAMAAIATEIHQPLDRHRHFAPQIAFYREFLDVFANPIEFRIGQILDLAASLYARGGADRLARARPMP